MAVAHRGRSADPSTAHVPLALALIVFSGLLTYAGSLGVPFHFDDEIAVVRNEQIRRLWPLSAALSPPAGGAPVAGRPLVNLSFAVNYALGRLDPWGYHAVNVGLHLLCALVLYGIIRRTASLNRMPAAISDNPSAFALVCALLWMLHPISTQVATYVSGRTESLMGFFYFLTLYCGIRASAPGRGAWTAGAVTACALGMASKESMVTAPLMMILYDRSFAFDSFGAAWRKRRVLYLGLVATLGILAALVAQGPRSDSAGFSTGISPWTYLLNQSTIIVHYLKVAAWPRALVFDYGEPLAVSLETVAPAAGVVTALFLVAVAAWFARPAAGFAALWFFVTLAPTSSVVPIATEVGADRRMYLPLAGLVVLAVGLASWPWARVCDSLRSRGLPLLARGASVLVAILLCGALAIGTVQRNAEYASGLTLWRGVLERWPSPRAHRNLAVQLKASGYREEVLHHLRQAVDAHPEVRHALGAELLEQGHTAEAIEALQTFIEWSPDGPQENPARQLLGQALASAGRHREAADQFRTVLEANPADARARSSLANALHAQARFDEAIKEYREYLRLVPRDGAGWENLGVAQLQAERIEDASGSFRRALELNPSSGGAHRNLALTLLSAGDVAGAVDHAQRALQVNGRDAGAHYLLGLAAEAQDRHDEAIVHFRACLTLDPGNVDARARLNAALSEPF